MTISMDALAEEAVTTTGLDDFGPDGWQIGLARLLTAVDADLGHDPATVAMVERIIAGRLASRLQIERWYVDQASAPPPVEDPLVIVGLPRTATTALHYLLSVDPQFRYPRSWEMATPAPPPDPATEQDDPRRAAAMSRSADVRHISSVDGPTEDGSIHALHFGHQELALPVPTYSAWWRDADMAGMFAYQERVLRLLHSRRPPHRWLLKAPAYLFHLPAMSRHYPGARFVMTHRDPQTVLPSACSVVFDARRQVLPGFEQNKVALGAEVLQHFAQGVRQAVEARSEIGEDRFVDVAQQDMEHDPVGTAERIYDFAGLELTDDVKIAMGEWANANRKGSRGAHVYTAEEFGLTAGGIRDAFGDYSDRFTPFVTPAAS